MRKRLLFLGLLFPFLGVAQEHWKNTYSVSMSVLLNPATSGKGVDIGLHYHLNGFDDLRFTATWKREYIPTESLAGNGLLVVQTALLNLDFAKGFKINPNGAFYLIGGIKGGQEEKGSLLLPLDIPYPSKRYIWITGFRFKMELEVRLAKKWSLQASMGQQFLFFSDRFPRFEIIAGARYYW